MHRIPVSSEGITQVGYHQDTDTYGTLELQFASGSVFQFFNVPTKTYDEFMHATSMEEYYASKIGKRYPCQRI